MSLRKDLRKLSDSISTSEIWLLTDELLGFWKKIIIERWFRYVLDLLSMV